MLAKKKLKVMKWSSRPPSCCTPTMKRAYLIFTAMSKATIFSKHYGYRRVRRVCRQCNAEGFGGIGALRQDRSHHRIQKRLLQQAGCPDCLRRHQGLVASAESFPLQWRQLAGLARTGLQKPRRR